jgi:hypothetical protein
VHETLEDTLCATGALSDSGRGPLDLVRLLPLMELTVPQDAEASAPVAVPVTTIPAD